MRPGSHKEGIILIKGISVLLGPSLSNNMADNLPTLRPATVNTSSLFEQVHFNSKKDAHRRYRERHKAEIHANQREYVQRNREWIIAQKHAYRLTPAGLIFLKLFIWKIELMQCCHPKLLFLLQIDFTLFPQLKKKIVFYYMYVHNVAMSKYIVK